jgi:hypothetical protein
MPKIDFSPAAKFKTWLDRFPCPLDEPGEPCINAWIAKAVGACHFRGIPATDCDELVRTALTRPEKAVDEVRRTVERKYSCALAPLSSANSSPSGPLVQYDAELLEAQASQVPFEITDDWLAERSLPTKITPAQYLDAIFRPEECVAVMNAKQDRGFMYRPGESVSGRRLPKHLDSAAAGAWYVSNPVNGEVINGSFRRESNITDFRHLMIESDKAPRDLWLRVIVQLCAPILAIYESGRRSVHAIIRVNAINKLEFDAIAAQYKRQLVPVGMCPGSGKAVQPTRLPNVIRADNFAVQRLLYLRPEADATPIFRK